MALSNGKTGGLVEQYNKIVGDSDNQKSINGDEFRIEFFSMYEKSDYETRTYSNLNNFK